MSHNFSDRYASVSPATRRAGAVLFAVCLGLSGFGMAQTPQVPSAKPSAAVPATSGLPPAQPTSVTSPSVQKSVEVPQRIEVEYVGGELTVQTENGSLNQILRQISGKTGMKITGGVTDERVFGHYGPSAPSVILASLLDGTESNMLLVDSNNGSSELVLTPRHGGVTPPNPNATAQQNGSDEENGGRYVAPVRPFQPPFPRGRGPVSMSPEGSQPAPQVPTEPNVAPDAEKTPQQIFDQLQRTSQTNQPQSSTPQ